MSVLLTTLLSSLIPVGIEGVKQLIVSKTGVQATTVDEQIKLDDQEIKRLEAIAKLDTPGGTPSQWVIDLRASARYVAAGVVILGGVAAIYIPGLDSKSSSCWIRSCKLRLWFSIWSKEFLLMLRSKTCLLHFLKF